MILVQPLNQHLIRKNPIYSEPVIILERLNADLSIDKEIASAPDGYNVQMAFAFYANNNYIKPKGWVELDMEGTEGFTIIWKKALDKLQKKDLYYGSS